MVAVLLANIYCISEVRCLRSREKKESFEWDFQKMKIYGLTFKKMYVNLFSTIKSNGY